jgi:iron complex outermembrane receptor protein
MARPTLGGIGLVTCAMAGISSAASAAEPTPSVLEEVVVTAQFREERLQETPIAITAITDEMMRARGQDAIYDVAQQAPNVQIKKQSGPFGSATTAFIRGIGQGDFNFALEPGVGMYIDDIYFPTMTGSAFEIVDLERVEILRGPQGTLQGRNAIGGSVRLITRKPTGDGTGYAEVTTGSFSRFGARGAADIALADNLFLRVTGASNSQDGYVDRLDFACHQPDVAANLGITSSGYGKKGCKIGTLGGQSYTAGRAALRWVATDDLELTLTADLVNDKSEAAAMVLVDAKDIPVMGPQWGPWFNVAKEGYYTYETFCSPTSGFNPVVGFERTPYCTPPINHLKNWGTALTIDWSLTDTLALKSITSYRELYNDFSTAHDGSPLSGENGYNELNGHSFQQEVRLSGTAGILDYTLGLFYFTQKNQNRNRIDLGYNIGPGSFDFISDEIAETDAKAAFLHTVWHVTERFSVTAGVRYSDEEKDQLLGRLNPADGGLTPSQHPAFAALLPTGGYAPVVTFSADRWDWRLSLDYKWTDTFMTYATASTGFKSGGVSPRFFAVSHILPFQPEELTAYEIGFKSDLFNRRLRLNGAVFLNDYTDQQVGAPGSICPGLVPESPCLATVNAQDSEYSGVELEAVWQVGDNTTIDLSGSWMDAKYTRISPLVLQNPNFIRDPDGPPNLPQYKYSIGVQHSVDLASGARLTGRIDYNHEAERTPNVTTSMGVESFDLVNVRLTWLSEDRAWEVSGALNNALDEYYYNNVFDISGFGGWTGAQPAMPREWSLTVRRNF